MNIRRLLSERPMLGWALAAVLALLTAWSVYRNTRTSETRELAEEVTIRCRETGKEWKLPRGVMEKQLYMRPYPVNPDEGLINPETGKPTGFPVDDWKAMINRINTERKGQAEKGATPK